MPLSTPPPNEAKSYLHERIRNNVIRTGETHVIIADEHGRQSNWLLDFRRIFLNADDLNVLSELFWERFASRLPFQIGGMESASIPLITALVLKGKERGTSVRGFYIRKSRKKIGLLKQVEGEMGDEPVVLVDDLINDGNTFLKQVVLLEALGKKVQAVFAIVRFNELEHYAALTDKHIPIETLFELKDFGLVHTKRAQPRHDRFITEWYFRSAKADLHRVERKSTPALSATTVYFGTDDGYVYALSQLAGAELWRFKVGLKSKGSYSISNLIRSNSVLYFASKNGKVFALHANTGAVLWVFNDADWCTSEIAAISDNNLLYVGINTGWFNKRNYLVALHMESGVERWRAPMPDSVQSVSAGDTKRVGVGCGDGTFFMLRAEDGSLIWSHKADGSIIGGSARLATRSAIVFGSMGGFLYILELKTGVLIEKIKFESGIATTPLIVDQRIIVSCLDKKVYCIDADTAKMLWKFETKGRIFADPVLVNGRVYVGSDDSRLYEIDINTGTCVAFFQTVERITNPVMYAPQTGYYFLTTYANELYCLTEKAATS
jgi:outer membrane protein assembly factor BamB/orotate phosphoribosyltransferase